MIDRIKALLKDRARMRELISYVVFGLLTTLVNWLAYWLLTSLFGLDSHPAGSGDYKLVATLCNGAAWIISVVFAYFTNKRFVFLSREKRSSAWREFALFVSARLMSYLLFDLLLFRLCLNLMGDKLAKLLMNVLVVIFNYFASKFVIFQKKG